jgi:hypothetical protein
LGLCLGPGQLRSVQQASCIVIDQAIQPELLRGTLVKELLQLVADQLVIPQQFDTSPGSPTARCPTPSP